MRSGSPDLADHLVDVFVRIRKLDVGPDVRGAKPSPGDSYGQRYEARFALATGDTARLCAELDDVGTTAEHPRRRGDTR